MTGSGHYEGLESHEVAEMIQRCRSALSKGRDAAALNTVRELCRVADDKDRRALRGVFAKWQTLPSTPNVG